MYKFALYGNDYAVITTYTGGKLYNGEEPVAIMNEEGAKKMKGVLKRYKGAGLRISADALLIKTRFEYGCDGIKLYNNF